MIQSLLQKIRSNTFMRYIFIGGASFVIEISVLFALTNVIGLRPVVGVAISFWIGLIASFLLQKYLAFQDRNSSSKRLLRQTVAYMALVGFNYTFTIVFVHLVEPVTELIVARTLALVITTFWNFIIYSKIIFKPSPATETTD